MCIFGLTTYRPKTLTSVPDCSFSTLLKAPVPDLRIWVWSPVLGNYKTSQWGKWNLKPEVARNLKRETVRFWKLSKKRRRRRNYRRRSRRFLKQYKSLNVLFTVFPNTFFFTNIQHFKSCRSMKALLQEWRPKRRVLQTRSHQRTLDSLEINTLGDGFGYHMSTQTMHII